MKILYLLECGDHWLWNDLFSNDNVLSANHAGTEPSGSCQPF